MPSFVPRKKRAIQKNAHKAKGKSSSAARDETPDAINLLKADHREVEELFGKFEKAKSTDRKKAIVAQICDALTVHAKIEEAIFYPKAREALKRAEEDVLDEAFVEHEGIKWRVGQLENAEPGDDNYYARVTVLKEYVTHHVKEEERELFPKIRATKLDLKALGAQLAARKEALTGKPVVEQPSMIERGLRALTGASAHT